MDMLPNEAHKLWHLAIAGKEGHPTDFGAFVSVFGLGATTFIAKAAAGRDQENKERREMIAKFLRTWAENLDGKN